MLEKGFIVPNADFERENPAIPLSEWNLKVSVHRPPFISYMEIESSKDSTNLHH